MVEIRRVSIDEHLPNDPNIVGPVRNLAALKAVAVALDQAVNRCRDDVARWGHIDPGTLAGVEGEYTQAQKHLDVLAAGYEAGSAMLAAVRAQVNPAEAEAMARERWRRAADATARATREVEAREAEVQGRIEAAVREALERAAAEQAAAEAAIAARQPAEVEAPQPEQPPTAVPPVAAPAIKPRAK